MIGVPRNCSLRAERINGLWHVSVHNRDGEVSDNWVGEDLSAVSQAAFDCLAIRTAGHPAVKTKNDRNAAVRYWHAVRRLNSILERVS